MIEDTSTKGTRYSDGESQTYRSGTLCFRFFGHPQTKQEILRRDRWHKDLDPVPITTDLLRDQLLGATAGYRSVEKIGQGGMSTVYQDMELTTGLMIAVKEEDVKNRDGR